MTKLLRRSIGSTSSAIATLAVPLLANAAIGSGLSSANSSLNTSVQSSSLTGATSLPTIIGKGIGVMLGVLGIAFVVMVVYAGFLYLTAQGEDTNVKKAKKLMTQAVIGMVIVVSAYAISSYVIAALTRISGST